MFTFFHYWCYFGSDILHHCRGTDTFNTLWDSLSESINNVKLVAVSCTLSFLMYSGAENVTTLLCI
jgi:hypothetical protein